MRYLTGLLAYMAAVACFGEIGINIESLILSFSTANEGLAQVVSVCQSE